jgi:hypothetical protein
MSYPAKINLNFSLGIHKYTLFGASISCERALVESDQLLRLLDFNILASAMYLSDDSHEAMDLLDRTSIDVYRLSILAHE